MSDITLKHLRVLAAVARCGKVVSAASALGVTPPAVTLQVQQLEEIVGLALFERARDGMRLTDAGRSVLSTARRIETELAACTENIEAMRGLSDGTVSIGVVSTAKYFAPAALAAFARQHPKITMRLFVGNRQQVIKALAALDLDLVLMGRPPEGVPVESAWLGDHPHVIISAPDHPLAHHRRILLPALANEVFLMREVGSGTRTLLERVFSEAAVPLRTGMEMDSNETIKQAVMAGLGIAFISAHTIAAEVDAKRLAILDVVSLPTLRQWQIVRHIDKRVMPAAAALWEFLAQNTRSFLPSSGRKGRKRSGKHE